MCKSMEFPMKHSVVIPLSDVYENHLKTIGRRIVCRRITVGGVVDTFECEPSDAMNFPNTSNTLTKFILQKNKSDAPFRRAGSGVKKRRNTLPS